MITKVQAYQTASGVFPTIEEAQKAELKRLWSGQCDDNVFADWAIENKEAILDILTMTASSKPRARKINGGKKTRKAVAPSPELGKALTSLMK